MEDSQLRKLGLKVTGPRLKILHIFETTKQRHLSAEAVHQRLQQQGDHVSLATIYRVLTQFEIAGLLKRHHFDADHAVFELDNDEHHDHLVCIECGVVKEFVDADIEKRQHVIAKQAQFEMTDHNLTIYGRCSDCQV